MATAQEALDSAKSAHHRIDGLEVEVKDIRSLTTAMGRMDEKVDNLKSDVDEIKADVKAITARPSQWWDKLIAAAIGGNIHWNCGCYIGKNIEIKSGQSGESRHPMNYQILFIIALAIIVFLAIYFASIKLAQKKIDASKALENIGTGITYAQSIAEAISPFIPSVADGIIKIILKIASQAVTHVEATYKAAIATGTDALDTRSVEATSLVKSGLALEGIEGTEQIDKLINTVIPLLVLALPKTHTETKAVSVTAV